METLTVIKYVIAFFKTLLWGLPFFLLFFYLSSFVAGDCNIRYRRDLKAKAEARQLSAMFLAACLLVCLLSSSAEQATLYNVVSILPVAIYSYPIAWRLFYAKIILTRVIIPSKDDTDNEHIKQLRSM